MDFTATLSEDCLLLIFGRVPLHQRLTTVPLVCRRWAQLQPRVRSDVTSLTLIFGFHFNKFLRSPFYLVANQESIRDDPNLLQLSRTRIEEQHAPPAVERLLLELPYIRRLTIIQLNHSDSLPAFQAELWPVMETYARQLTRFDFHYLYYDSNLESSSDRQEDGAVSPARTALSADFQRLLALINYRMPRLRHLLLNSYRSVFHARRRYVFAVGYFPLGSLYLPVLRRLASFSFRTGDHEDVLLGSLRSSVLGAPREEPFSTMDGQLWTDGDELLRPTLDYLFVERVKLDTISTILPSLASLQYLHLELTDGGTNLLPLFTALSTSLPLLSRLYLNLGQTLVGGPLKPADLPHLPPLPSVTSLSLEWPFDDPAHFGAVLQPARVFPALQRLTIDGRQIFKRCPFSSSSSPECRCPREEPGLMSARWVAQFAPKVVCIRLALKAPLMQYPPGATVRKVVFNSNHGRKEEWIVEEL
ncbi:hypothetical protein TYRP_011447 [Tyrophagus putrescentiae]|nr:hypothetical protein TYRP_011447 [Tyrophagus putrescentiae]